jgi:hypothetical protein
MLHHWGVAQWVVVFLMGGVGLLRGALVINEIHYNPAVKTEAAKFVELYNTDTNAVDLSAWSFTSGINFTFPQGTSLGGLQFAIVAQNPTFLKTKYGAQAYGPYTGTLSSQGDKLTLRDAAGNIQNQVGFQLGFPWPTVGDLPGYSIELINPSLDNTLGGSWRASIRVADTNSSAQAQTLITAGSVWRYHKGTNEASSPTDAWRMLDFDDSSWPAGAAPIGYDPTISMGTFLGDMRGNYVTIYARRTFVVQKVAEIGALLADVEYDDGFNLWINGHHVQRQAVDRDEMAYNELANTTRENAGYDTFSLPIPFDYLREGTNVIAIQVHNILFSDSSDAFFDLRLRTEPVSVVSVSGPTPGRINSVFASNAPPQIRQVANTPKQPMTGQEVKITAKITDPDGVRSVKLEYQLVDPGQYIALSDAVYQTQWTAVAMQDDGQGGDVTAGDDVYTVVMPASLQTNRRLVRYRITAVDNQGLSITVPYADDPQPNFAYYVYDGVPAWSGAARPGSTPVQEFGTNVMRSLPVYQLISKKTTVEKATWYDQYTGNLYPYQGTVVIDGEVLDHIRFRARGGCWRYAMGKNMWKFDLNRGHDFLPVDNYGRGYNARWKKINLGACIQQGDYGHRGEQGMFESIGFKLFNLAGIEAPRTHFAQLRIVDDVQEANAANQYDGDFWGLYLAIEQEDGRFLDEHGLPDGNFYKMDGGTGELNNQGPTAVSDRSDLTSFMTTYQGSPTDAWWRTNLDLARYYNYRTIVEAIHHYDIDEGAGKNYMYYRNPVTGIWSEHPWDLDLTWADNMYGGGVSPFKNRVLPRAAFALEYRNRIREIRDLLFNPEQAGLLIDEYAAMIHDPSGGLSFTDADRAQWDYNPIMVSSYVNSSKAGQGRYYQWPYEPTVTKNFTGTIQLMKNYVKTRGAYLDALAVDTAIPSTPVVTFTGPTNYPANQLVFSSSPFVSASGTFAAMKWRLAEISPASAPIFDPAQPRKYEITATWESGEVSNYVESVTIPASTVKVGHTYRVRVRMKDVSGRWSHWSAPVEFVAGDRDEVLALRESLRITEVMYDPIGGSEYEYIELYNASETETMDLGGVTFTQGINYTFDANTVLGHNEYLLLVKASSTNNFADFRAHYHLNPTVRIVGPYSGSLDNNGETVTLKSASAGTEIISFNYGNGSGWPVSADGAGHSLVPLNYTLTGSPYDYARGWRASAFAGGSPGTADPAPQVSVVLNEIMACTTYSDPLKPEYVSNDWIELYNATDAPVLLEHWFLSDDPSLLAKWAIPAQTVGAHERVVFDEVSGFHNPITSGFGLSRFGESVFLSCLPGDGTDRVADAVRFKAQEPNISWGRYPDGGEYWMGLEPTRGTTNGPPAGHLLINEIMYHPLAFDTNDNTRDEYIEIFNPTANSIMLSDTNGAWRIDGSVKYTFPTNTVVLPGQCLLVAAEAKTNTVDWNAFIKRYGLDNYAPTIVGPFEGKLPNDAGRVALESPQATGDAGNPIAWVVEDEVIYSDGFPWYPAADGVGASLQRTGFQIIGNDPMQWAAADPTPGNEPWANHIELSAPKVVGEGMFSVQVQCPPFGTVVVDSSTDLSNPGQWQPVYTNVTHHGSFEFSDTNAPAGSNRFYRIRRVP